MPNLHLNVNSEDLPHCNGVGGATDGVCVRGCPLSSVSLRRFQQALRQVAHPVHHSLDGNARFAATIKNQVRIEAPAHSHRAQSRQFGVPKPAKTPQLRDSCQLRHCRIKRRKESLSHGFSRVVHIPAVLVGQVGFRPPGNRQFELRFEARAALRTRSSVSFP